MTSLSTLASTKTVLFLTTGEYSGAPSVSDPYSTAANISTLPVPNRLLAETLFQAGVDVRFSSWSFPAAGSTRATLCRFDVVLFLCCAGYGDAGSEAGFCRFLDQTLIPLGDVLGAGKMRVVNDARVVRWGVGREWRGELKGVGFVVEMGEAERRVGVGYSLVYIGGRYSHAGRASEKMGRGGNQIDGKDDEGSEEVRTEDVPKGALDIGHRLCEWLDAKFGKGMVGYMRLDGRVAEYGGGFVIDHVGLIEPELWLTRGDSEERVDRFVKCLLETQD